MSPPNGSSGRNPPLGPPMCAPPPIEVLALIPRFCRLCCGHPSVNTNSDVIKAVRRLLEPASSNHAGETKIRVCVWRVSRRDGNMLRAPPRAESLHRKKKASSSCQQKFQHQPPTRRKEARPAVLRFTFLLFTAQNPSILNGKNKGRRPRWFASSHRRHAWHCIDGVVVGTVQPSRYALFIPSQNQQQPCRARHASPAVARPPNQP